MVALGVLFIIVAFITADVVIRMVMKRQEEAKLRQKRAEALDTGMKLDFADEAKSLKRVEVENPKAYILAVDDEAVILDSFRKILVLAGYSIDTVEMGQEALTLVKEHDYDFVFTDLKMPEMDGVQVVKGVKHLRPDIDVIVITGYAAIDTAVETMKDGAMDYVEKPFTEEELVEFVDKSLIRRQAKLDKKVRPQLHLVTPASGKSQKEHEFNVPAGIFVSPNHAWVAVQPNGAVRVGIDDFTQKLIGDIDAVELPHIGQQVKKDEPIFAVKQGDHALKIRAPLSGKVLAINEGLLDYVDPIKTSPYEGGWIFSMDPQNLSAEMASLRIGAEAINWYQKEADKYMDIVRKVEDAENLSDELLTAYSRTFFHTDAM